MDLIYSTSVRGEGLDKLRWRLAKSGDFKMCGYYQSLSLEVGVVVKDSTYSSFLFMDCCFGEDFVC